MVPARARTVQILDDVVVNQIAAGEVVERPSSVVKELVENAIDAGSSEIRISIANGGKSVIEVQDNGCGMSKADALIAIQRFGTSKIQSSADLERISTLGFRGEAIPSIASVSRFKVTSAQAGSSNGVQILIEGGVQKSVDDIGCPAGTTVEVRNLFFNVPARKKFLRTESTEASQVRALMSDFALAYPQIRFSLTIDGSAALNYPEVADFAARMQQIRLAGTQPLTLHEQFINGHTQVTVRGVICSPIESAGNAAKLRLLVNGRSVRDKVLLRAVREGYGTFLRPGRHPAGVVALELPPEEVDVNVHPQKTEVRFRNSSEVFRAVMLSVSRALSRSGADDLSLPPETADGLTHERSQMLPSHRFETQTASLYATRPTFQAVQQAVRFVSSDSAIPYRGDAHPTMALSKVDDLTEMRFVGQILSLYLLFEGQKNERGMFAMVDMHAAHERVMFYRIKKQVIEAEVESQQLLLPLDLQLGPEETARFAEGKTVFERLGFHLSESTDGVLQVDAVPSVLAAVPIAEILRDILSEPEIAGWSSQLETHLDHLLARVACHASVRSGRVLKEEEVWSLVESMKNAETSGLCPHGRPVVRYFSEYELEQLFGRVQ